MSKTSIKCSQEGGGQGQKISKGLHFKMMIEVQKHDYRAVLTP